MGMSIRIRRGVPLSQGKGDPYSGKMFSIGSLSGLEKVRNGCLQVDSKRTPSD